MGSERRNRLSVPEGPLVDAESPGTEAASLGLERALLRRLLELSGHPPLRFLLWDGATVAPRGAAPECTLRLRDRGALWRILAYPEYQFPEMYAQGRLEVEGNLERLMEILQRARRDIGARSLRQRLLAALFRPHPGSLRAARENIHHHYDLGNDFYRLWLDEEMLYTCAYYPEAATTLEEAQRAKMELVCRKLRLRPGERVVEAGCGWGALALYMARHHGVRVRAFNISRAQLEWARERAAGEGLEDRVEFVEGDYREIRGHYDAFVSVGMLEHVGQEQYPRLGAVMDAALEPHGRGLIHTIGSLHAAPMNTWIERRIFPGARPPTLDQMMDLFAPRGFSVLDVENLRLHYAWTLHDWLERFEAHRDAVRERFGETFVRAWRFYLASSEAAFVTGNLQLYQVLFSRNGYNELPRTRAYMCLEQTAGQ